MNVKKQLKKRYEYLKADAFVVLLAAAILMLVLLGFYALFQASHTRSLVYFATSVLLLAGYEWIYRMERKRYEKWLLYKANLNIPAVTSTDQGKTFYQEDDKYYAKLTRAMEE